MDVVDELIAQRKALLRRKLELRRLLCQMNTPSVRLGVPHPYLSTYDQSHREITLLARAQQRPTQRNVDYLCVLGDGEGRIVV
jgi:hypothetical protein